MLYFDQYLAKHNHSPSIPVQPSEDTSIIIVIPCFNEPDILLSLDSLYNCNRDGITVEVIVVVNFGEQCSSEAKEFNKLTFQNIQKWAAEHKNTGFSCFAMFAPNLPAKFAGVGLARKIGMDEAASRFNKLNRENGIICGFDADAKVEFNYFMAISDHFKRHLKSPGASIYFEHPVDEISDVRMRSGIIQYETHLRYLVNAIRYTGFPNAYHTVGSSFAIRAGAYVKQGGMNKFKAGEDFYFLNKIISLGNYTEINDTKVFPQARVSGRVPFGTGASMTKWMATEEEDFLTYQFASFLPLKALFSNIDAIYRLKSIPAGLIADQALKKFLLENESQKAIEQILNNSGSFQSFQKRFFNWFDSFRIVKYLNLAAQKEYPRMAIKTESEKLLRVFGKNLIFDSKEEMLFTYRLLDRVGIDKFNP
jgi:hypothetical protein